MAFNTNTRKFGTITNGEITDFVVEITALSEADANSKQMFLFLCEIAGCAVTRFSDRLALVELPPLDQGRPCPCCGERSHDFTGSVCDDCHYEMADMADEIGRECPTCQGARCTPLFDHIGRLYDEVPCEVCKGDGVMGVENTLDFIRREGPRGLRQHHVDYLTEKANHA